MGTTSLIWSGWVLITSLYSCSAALSFTTPPHGSITTPMTISPGRPCWSSTSSSVDGPPLWHSTASLSSYRARRYPAW